jgi:hypothetical protein
LAWIADAHAALKLTALEQPIIRTAPFLQRIPEFQNSEILFRVNINSFKYSAICPRQIEKMAKPSQYMVIDVRHVYYVLPSLILSVSLTYTMRPFR